MKRCVVPVDVPDGYKELRFGFVCKATGESVAAYEVLRRRVPGVRARRIEYGRREPDAVLYRRGRQLAQEPAGGVSRAGLHRPRPGPFSAYTTATGVAWFFDEAVPRRTRETADAVTPPQQRRRNPSRRSGSGGRVPGANMRAALLLLPPRRRPGLGRCLLCLPPHHERVLGGERPRAALAPTSCRGAAKSQLAESPFAACQTRARGSACRARWTPS